MDLREKNIGIAISGGFYSFRNIIDQMKEIKSLGGNIIPIMSFNSFVTDTRFGDAEKFIEEIEDVAGNKIITSIQRAEEIGLNKETDILVVAPATRKYYSKVSKWNYRYSCNNRCKVCSSK